ncbi:MAG: AMP-binding protein, partial [Betaproteobacteria bacterium]|nr:AMP-binding protein [Betaproteobacteria bacterium]
MEARHWAHWPHDMPRSLSPPPLRLHDLLARAASRFPDKPATVFQGASLSYRALAARAEALAGHLQHACGVAKGDRVLLDLQNGPDFIAALFGILRADAVAVPVSPANVAAELR